MRTRILALALLLASVALAGETVDTGFDPVKDGLPYTNIGSYATPNGDCFGMSTVALMRWRARKAGNAASHDDYDLPGRALAGLIQTRYLAAFHEGLGTRLDMGLHDRTDPQGGRLILDQLEKGEPVLVHLVWATGGAHVVLFVGYADGAFKVYDPNSPGDLSSWSWSSKDGFSRFSESFSLGGKVQQLALYDPSDVAAMPRLKDLEALRDDCDNLGNACAAPYSTVSLESHRSGSALVVSGTVTGGLAADAEGRPSSPATQAIVFVNGSAEATVNLDRSGHFDAKLPKYLLKPNGNVIRVAAITSRQRLAGFSEVAPDGPAVTRGLANALGSGPP